LKKTYRKDLKNKNVLIIGGAGFIGSHLIDHLLTKKLKKIVVVDNLSVGRKENLKNILNKIVFKKHNAENFVFLKKLIKKYQIDYVFNLATIALPFSFKFPRKTFETNIKIILNLLELLKEKKFNSLCHFSTSEIYGTSIYAPMDENHPTYPTTTYASGKLAADKALISYNKMFNLDAFIVRPFNNYGPRQLISRNEIGVIPKTIKRIHLNKSPIIYGNGKQKRDFIYVKDTVDYIINSFTKIPPGHEVNICSNNPIEIKKLINLICKITKCKKKILYKNQRIADVYLHHGDNTKLKKIVKIKKNNFLSNIKDTINFYMKYLNNEK
jgi:UDP-glucose 4-epimerase